MASLILFSLSPSLSQLVQISFVAKSGLKACINRRAIITSLLQTQFRQVCTHTQIPAPFSNKKSSTIIFRWNIYRNVDLLCCRFASIRWLDTERCGVSLQSPLQSALWHPLCFWGWNHVFLLTEEFLFRNTAMLIQALLFYHCEWIFGQRWNPALFFFFLNCCFFFFLEVYFHSPTLWVESVPVSKPLVGNDDFFFVLIWTQSKYIFLWSWFIFVR